VFRADARACRGSALGQALLPRLPPCPRTRDCAGHARVSHPAKSDACEGLRRVRENCVIFVRMDRRTTFELALTACATLFATIGPVDCAVIFASLTFGRSRASQGRMALQACAIASAVLALAAVGGKFILSQLGVSLAALQAAGGIILLLIALDMVFARPHGAFTITGPETSEARHKDDIVVFPLAIPLLAGPGAISSAIILTAKVQGEIVGIIVVLGALLAVMAIAALFMLMAREIHRAMGVTAQNVVLRVSGILLAAVAMQFVFDALAASGLLTGKT
jgi:multiple antibiotic resistance protein